MLKATTSMSTRLGALGIGTSAIGNLYREVDDGAARLVIERAWEAGVRYFDTAPHYGLGLAEERLGRYLSGVPRDEFVVSTKVGRILEPVANPSNAVDSEGFAVPADRRRVWDFSASGVRRSLEDSLARTGFDRIDILFLHDPEEFLDQAIEEALPALEALKAAGTIRAIGVGSTDVDAMTRLVKTGALDLAMVAGRYTLLEQPASRELFPAAAAAGTEIVAVGVFNSGLLATSSPGPDARYEYDVAPAEIVARAQRLAAVCARHGVELPHAAVQFALRHPLVSTVTVGIGKPSHVPANVEWATTPVPEALWDELTAEGLIPVEATND